jgi:hypothetical protein
MHAKAGCGIESVEARLRQSIRTLSRMLLNVIVHAGIVQAQKLIHAQATLTAEQVLVGPDLIIWTFSAAVITGTIVPRYAHACAPLTGLRLEKSL